EYNPRFGVLVDIVRCFNYYIINGIPSKIVSLGMDSIYIVLLSFVADFVK
ncbi:hypothetical protein GE21DRAFT_1213500, partial [Neurospora crassa]